MGNLSDLRLRYFSTACLLAGCFSFYSMVTVSGIQKRFGDLQVLKNVDLHIPQAKVASIVGASGAGKTTLLQIIGTLLKADLGKVQIGKHKVSEMTEKQLAQFRNQEIGFVFQFHHLLPEFTALENVCIPAFIAKKPRKDVEQRAKDLLQFLGLNNRTTHKPNELSGGEQQRVAVARALINEPQVILADEPSGNLDTHNKTELHQLFFDLRDKYDQTFVIVTHDTELAEMSDIQVQMQDGKII